MEAVVLKGRKSGFEIQVAQEAALATVEAELTALLTKLAQDTPDEAISFRVETGLRLLTEPQQQVIADIFAQHARFELEGIYSDVVEELPLRQLLASQAIHLVGGVVRSGQVVDSQGDVLFIGDLHLGGTIRAAGNIFVLGPVQGLLIAGANGDQQAVIAGDISHAAQIRIADTVEIIEESDLADKRLAFINDLHILDHAAIAQILTLRPKLFRKLEDL